MSPPRLYNIIDAIWSWSMLGTVAITHAKPIIWVFINEGNKVPNLKFVAHGLMSSHR